MYLLSKNSSPSEKNDRTKCGGRNTNSDVCKIVMSLVIFEIYLNKVKISRAVCFTL